MKKRRIQRKLDAWESKLIDGLDSMSDEEILRLERRIRVKYIGISAVICVALLVWLFCTLGGFV